MNRSLPRLLAATFGLASGTIASAAPIVIDNEQKAAAALVGATNIIHMTPLYHSLLVGQIQLHASIGLGQLNSATTPAALMASPAGLTLPCATSGTLKARMAARKPRVLKLEWQDCHFLQYGWPYSLNGPAEIVLLSDSFTPQTVASIRFGDAHTDLVQTREVVTPDQTNHDTIVRNLRLTGAIPMSVFQTAGSTTRFAYVLNGFVDETFALSFPDREPYSYGDRYIMESLTYAGSVGYDTSYMVVDEDLRVLLGELTFESRLPPPYSGGSEKSRYSNLRIHHVTDYGTNWDRTTTLDGKVDFQWFSLRSPGCQSGGYSFRTFSPIHRSLDNFERFDAGDLGINNKVRASFYSAGNVPPGLPVPTQGMLIHNQVAGVGTFNYDVDTARVGLWSVSGCNG